MAFLEGYTGGENPGTWYTLGHDGERNLPVRFRVRPESRELREELDKKFQREERVRGVKIKRIPQKLQEKADVFQAARLWTDSQNLWIRLRTSGAVALYTAELNLNGNGPGVGDEVCLDGKLTDSLKEDILNGNMALTLAILGKGRLLDEQAVEEEEVLRKNS